MNLFYQPAYYTINGALILKELNIGGEAGGKANTAVVKNIPGIRLDTKGEIVIRSSDAPRFGALVNDIEILSSVK